MCGINEGRTCWGVVLALATLAAGCGESEPIEMPKPVSDLASGPPPLEPLGPGESSTADPGAVHEPGPPHESIRALGRIGPDAAPAVPLILNALGSKQRVCIVALGGIGPAAKPPIPKLVQLFEEQFQGDFLAGADADDAVAKLDLRTDIVEAMARIDPETAQKTALPSMSGWAHSRRQKGRSAYRFFPDSHPTTQELAVNAFCTEHGRRWHRDTLTGRESQGVYGFSWLRLR